MTTRAVIDTIQIGDTVRFSYKCIDNLVRVGNVCAIMYLHINRGMPSWGKEKNLFISTDSYPQLLSRGSLIIGKDGRLYTVATNIIDTERLDVMTYDDDIIGSPFDLTKTIQIDDILGMLIYHQGNLIEKI